jgi:hypothetical protein
MTMSDRICGECGLCCKVVAVSELDKPAGQWCPHYAEHKGCTIYQTRPDPCRIFRCAWLDHDEFDADWFPKKAGFFLWEDPVPTGRRLVVELDPDNPSGWWHEPYVTGLKNLADRSGGEHVEILIRSGETVSMLFPEGLIVLGALRELPIESGYISYAGRPRPYARYAEPGAPPVSATTLPLLYPAPPV